MMREADRLGLPALRPAIDETDDRAVVGDPDVAIDVQIADLADVASDGQPFRVLGRKAVAVGGRRIGEDLLLRGIDDVEVVEPGLVLEERADREDVIAPARARRDLDLHGRSLAGSVGRSPAPQDVLVVDDQQVAGCAQGDQLWRALGRTGAGDLEPCAEDDARLVGRRVDPVDRLGAAIEHERGRTRPEDEVADVGRDGVAPDRDDPCGSHGHDLEEPIETGDCLLPVWRDLGCGDPVRGRRLE